MGHFSKPIIMCQSVRIYRDLGITEHDSFSESELLELLSQGHPVRDLVHDLYVKLRAHSPFGLPERYS